MAAPGRDALKAMTRLVRIMAVLEDAGSVGVRRDRLFEVAEYGDADPGTQLGKDLKHLRDQGWQIDNIAGAGEAARYRMVSGDNRLRLRLTPAQLDALHRAVILSERADLAKRLGVKASSLPADVDSEVIPQSTELSLCLTAVTTRALVRFSYKGTPRVVHPGAVRFKNNQWYLTGQEDGSDVFKHFAVARMSAVTLDLPDTAQPVDTPPLALHPLRWDIDPPLEVTLRTSPELTPDVERWLLPPAKEEEHDGVVDLTYTVTHRAAFRARIYMLGRRVEIVDPPEFRDEVLDELRDLVGA
ncbi:helix-turn-helix transcriptional regulator [Nocardioides marmoribigeumensis]|uniref:DNA-binding transcriptional regulator YafY n=1 Tax=Nocardioides marmoribigeumensis TaxID=433649 RepID=A0ABU2BY84_9ACTN|nr:WYL domain-containing protein [Nocardioides marmoribigeumensis]MDR7363358.1 putative DNA-binding transcriptional regulator YafY [Nocardioides marmoribigeumensis]